MSRYIFEMIQTMNIRDIATQVVLQCTPMIVRMKVSNLLIIPVEDMKKVVNIVKGTDISYEVLLVRQDKVTVLMYRKEMLNAYLNKEEIQLFLQEKGYAGRELKEIFKLFKQRYVAYRSGEMDFPHEMGVLLGYPIEDVRGFIEQGGKNCLHNGYWKVYNNLHDKVRLFQTFEEEKEKLIHKMYKGVSLREIIDTYCCVMREKENVW